MKSKKAEVKTMADERSSALGTLHDVSIARLCLGCDRNVLGSRNFVVFM